MTVWKLRCQLLSSSQVGLFVDFFARLFTQLKFGVVQACILYKGHSVPQHVWLLTLLSHTEMSLSGGGGKPSCPYLLPGTLGNFPGCL